MNHAADNIRVLAASMVEKAKSGHPGGAMGGADFVNVLYSRFLVTDPDDPTWWGRDRFFLDPGHMSPMLYAVLALTGKFTLDELQQFRQWGSPTPGHPEVDVRRGIENTSGPLGQGHTMAVGSAIAERFLVARFGDVEYGTMGEVVRQEAESGILFNATLVRCMLENGIYEIPHFETDYPDIEAVEGGEFLDKLQDCYAKYGRDETIVITRSNKRANRFNEGIRRNVLYAEEEIESNDMLMVVKNNYYYTGHTENCPMHFIANGDIARLKRLRRYEDFYGFRFADVVLEFPDYEDTEIECRILLDTIASESPALTREESSRLFYEVEKDYLDVKSKIKRFKEIRENPHFNALQVKFSYAVTCHKAQGGQWKAVFVDRCLFGDEPMTRDMLRWLYTALTRATEKLYLVNFDPRFYE